MYDTAKLAAPRDPSEDRAAGGGEERGGGIGLLLVGRQQQRRRVSGHDGGHALGEALLAVGDTDRPRRLTGAERGGRAQIQDHRALGSHALGGRSRGERRLRHQARGRRKMPPGLVPMSMRSVTSQLEVSTTATDASFETIG